MKKMVLALVGVVALLAFGVAGPAAAATGSYSSTQLHYNVYYDGGYSQTLHGYGTPVLLPTNGSITNVSITVQSYNNGFTSDVVTLCWLPYLGTTVSSCTPFYTFTGPGTYTDSAVTKYNGLNPRGQVVIQHTLYGGTYPATPGTRQDTAVVSYSY